MALDPGTRLGPYEVTAQIGVGGMGEVYRATDTNLKRQVAIKVLPAAVAGDAERLARFQREAEVLAALNHPNIAQIHGLEKSNGAIALVMELVEGPTLADRIAHGAVPLGDALPIATQIAEALEAAHEQGIVHRDLKPANVKVRPDGTVKVLDFGLAKALEPAGAAAANASQLPTITTPAMTQAGMILGTAAYMSPEQARGKPVDRRADVWAFGCVLYEMLTGQRAFGGEDVTVTLARVVEREPDLDALPATVPPRVRQTIRLCLRKDLKQRARDIGDVLLALRGDFEDASRAGATANAPDTYRRPVAAWALAGAALAAAAGLAAIHFGEPAPEAPVIYTSIPAPEGTIYAFGNASLPVLSPDGTLLAFTATTDEADAGKTQLYVRPLASPTAQPLAGTDGAAAPFWSPDGRSIAFSADNKLKRVDAGGGGVLTLTDLPAPLRGGTWNADGVILFGVNGGNLLRRVSASGGASTTAGRLSDGENNLRFPFFLPGGRHFLYQALSNTARSGIRVGSLTAPDEVGAPVAEADSNAVYAGGHLLFLRENTLVAQPFDVTALKAAGEPVPVAEGIASYTSPARAAAFTASAQGALAFHTSVSAGKRQLTWYDSSGSPVGTLGEPAEGLTAPRIAPDGQTAAAIFRAPDGRGDVSLYDVARGVAQRFTFDPFDDSDAIWTPDGRGLIWRGRNGGTILRQQVAGTGDAQVALVLNDASRGIPQPSSVSPDGKWLLFTARGAESQDVLVAPLEESGRAGTPKPFLAGRFAERDAQFSPDGAWVAYVSNESGRDEIYVVAFPGGGGKRQISTEGATSPRWRRDGKWLYLRDSGVSGMEVTLRNDRLEVGQTRHIVNRRPSGGFDVAPDGRILAAEDVDRAAAATPAPLTLVQNWTRLLRK